VRAPDRLRADHALAVEDQLVLTSHQIQIHDGDTGIPGALCQHRFALGSLATVIWRTVDVEEDVGTGGRLGGRRTIRHPDVLAYRHACSNAVDLPERRRLLTDGEVAVLVEDAVVRQAALVVDPAYPAVREQCGCVVNSWVAGVVAGAGPTIHEPHDHGRVP
jgi:hypothetical protein